MNSTEGFNPAPVGPENNAEQQAALERLRQEEPAALLEFASSTLPKTERRRAGRIAKLITLFTLASTLTLREHEPNAPASPDDAKLTALTTSYLQNPASQSQWDTLTKELIDGVVNNSDSRHIGQLIFGNIAAYNDGGYFDGRKNTEASAKNELRGDLPEHAEKVIVRGGSMSVMNEGQTNQVVSINSSTRSAFALSGTATGFDVIPVGEQLPFTGFGPTPKDALQSGLEGAAGFFGDAIKTDTSLETETVDGGKRPRVTEKFDQNIHSLVGHPFHSYQMTETKQRPDGMYEITLMVQPGRVIETNNPAEVSVIEKPKD